MSKDFVLNVATKIIVRLMSPKDMSEYGYDLKSERVGFEIILQNEYFSGAFCYGCIDQTGNIVHCDTCPNLNPTSKLLKIWQKHVLPSVSTLMKKATRGVQVFRKQILKNDITEVNKRIGFLKSEKTKLVRKIRGQSSAKGK